MWGVSGLAGVRSSVPMDPEDPPPTRGVGFAVFFAERPSLLPAGMTS